MSLPSQFLPRPAGCTCGAGDHPSCLCGTTPADWTAAARTAGCTCGAGSPGVCVCGAYGTPAAAFDADADLRRLADEGKARAEEGLWRHSPTHWSNRSECVRCDALYPCADAADWTADRDAWNAVLTNLDAGAKADSGTSA